MVDERLFNTQCGIGSKDIMRVKRIQEWLGLNNFNVAIDGEYGRATEQSVKDFQKAFKLPITGIVDNKTFETLSAPMGIALQPIIPPKNATLGEMMVCYARQHLSVHPREIGGKNRGPWVRLYMQGKEGNEWPWCAGFVSFILKQACNALNRRLPFDPSPSCYVMAMNAKDKGIYRPGPEIGTMRGENLNGAIFFVEKTPATWSHTGIVYEAKHNIFYTIEGNTNDDGSAEGFEVCKRVRSYENKDFILLA
jgi:hypothetical protein